KFDRERNQFSRIKYFPVCQVSGQHRCRRERKEEIPEPEKHHIQAGSALLRANAGRSVRDLPQGFWARCEGPSGLQRSKTSPESDRGWNESRFSHGQCFCSRLRAQPKSRGRSPFPKRCSHREKHRETSVPA